MECVTIRNVEIWRYMEDIDYCYDQIDVNIM